MSHSSGIPVSKELHEQFGDAVTSGKVRLIKAQIKESEIVPVSSLPHSGASEEDDLNKVPSLLDAADPAYILFRTEDTDESGVPLWLLMCYVPDRSKVRDKMTYASSRSNLRMQLGSNRFSDEIFGTLPSDFNHKGFTAYQNMKTAEVPLTWSEQQAITEKEGGVFVGGSGTAYVHGIAFPVEPQVTQAIQGLLAGQHNIVQVSIDAQHEKILLVSAKDVSADELSEQVPRDVPSFIFYRYNHEYDGQELSPIVFVYSCPDGSGNTTSAPVRLRMLYSSSKANVEGIITSVGGSVALKMEVNQGSEFSEESISRQLHPEKAEEKKTFTKPKGPSKGGKRLIRSDKKE